MRATEIMYALVGVINAPARAPALYHIAKIKYPGREIQPQKLDDGTVTVKLALWGHEYKRRGPRPKNPPDIDPAAVAATIADALGPDYLVTAENTDKHITIYLKEIRQ